MTSQGCVRYMAQADGVNSKSTGRIRLNNGLECEAELHWYEAHGIGKREMKIKRLLD